MAQRGGSFRRGRGAAKRTSAAVRVLGSEVVKTRNQLAALLALTKDAPPDLGANQDVEIQRFLPACDKLVTAQLALPNKHEFLMVLRTLGQRMMDAMAPRVVWKLARKLENHTEPGDTRLMVEYLKGRGFFAPATALTEEERAEKMKRSEELEGKSLDELRQMALAAAKGE